MVIDLHAHAMPVQLLQRLRRGPVGGISLGSGDRLGGSSVVLDVGGGAAVVGPHALVDVDDRLAAMDAQGVDQQVLSCWIELLGTRLSVDDATTWSRAVNEAMALDVAARPDRFDGLGTVPLQSPRGAERELRHAVQDLGLAGVELPTTVDGAELAALDLAGFWATAEELRAIVLLHPVDPIGAERTGGSGLVDIIGSTAETATAVGHLARAGVLQRHPGLRLVLVHGGGVLPWLVGRTAAVGRARGDAALAALPSVLRRIHHDSLVHDPRVLRLLVDVVGADRVVVGTDWPFPHGEPDPVGMVTAALADDTASVDAVLHRTAEGLLRDVDRGRAQGA